MSGQRWFWGIEGRVERPVFEAHVGLMQPPVNWIGLLEQLGPPLGVRPPSQACPGRLQEELAAAENLQQEAAPVHTAISVQLICDCEQHIWDVTADCRVKQPAEL